MSKIKIAIIGIGNCASALVQGIYYYRNNKNIGLIRPEIASYTVSDIQVVCGFDVDERKVGRDISQAIFAEPNCTKIFCDDVPSMNIPVSMGAILDGIAPHTANYPKENRPVIAKNDEPNIQQLVEIIKKSGAEILLNYLPVGSQKATEFYAEAALLANVAFINNIPVFIASDKTWAKRFADKGIPLIGDDIKSQIGATILHRNLMLLLEQRGVNIDDTYQLNIGGNTDFLNMCNKERLSSKRISKTEAVQSVLETCLPNDKIHIGPSDYVPQLRDNKECFIRANGKIFGGLPVNFELKLSVEDSPNSAGSVVDVIRLCKIALDRKIGGVLIEPSALYMKHPPKQFHDSIAETLVEQFINSK